jgi:hypothetical protein
MIAEETIRRAEEENAVAIEKKDFFATEERVLLHCEGLYPQR